MNDVIRDEVDADVVVKPGVQPGDRPRGLFFDLNVQPAGDDHDHELEVGYGQHVRRHLHLVGRQVPALHWGLPLNHRLRVGLMSSKNDLELCGLLILPTHFRSAACRRLV